MPDKNGFETMEDVLNANAARERAAKMESPNIENVHEFINMSDDDLWLKMTSPEDLGKLWKSIYDVKGVKSDLNFKFQSATDNKYLPDNVFKESKEKGKTLNQVLETLVNQGVNKNKISTIRKVLRKKMNEILLAESNSPTYNYDDPIVDVIEAVPVINRGNGNIPRAQAVAISNWDMPERDMQVARVVSDDDDDDDEQMTTMVYNPNITIKDNYFGGTRRRRKRKSKNTRKTRKTKKTKKTRKQRRIRFRR